MHRNITYSENDFYCRYLGIALNRPHPMKSCGGRFCSFLEQSLGIKKLPYDLKLIDLVLEGLFTSDLFVEIPKDYFLKWKNYPERGNAIATDLNGDLKDAGYFDIYIIVGDETVLSDFDHPYDSSLKHQFTDKFSIQPPGILKSFEHPNGRVFYPYEAYFSYWRAYIILESLEECKFIDRYLSPEEGIKVFKKTIIKINERWNSNYSSAFDRLSRYRTFITQFKLSDVTINCTYGDISKHLLKLTNSTASDLESDLELLLVLDSTWKTKYKNNGINHFQPALALLKHDIYFLFEWLCSSGYGKKDLFKKWTYEGQQSSFWSQLKDVLDFEEITFSETFETYVPFYSQKITKWLSKIDVSESYSRLQTYNSFAPWIRSFCDLHTAINRNGTIQFVQPRVLDNLLVMTIRTEILLRAFYANIANISAENTPNDLKDVIGKLADFVIDKPGKNTLKTLSSKDSWDLTKLHGAPSDIFLKIDKCLVGKNWNTDQKYFFQSVLKFVVSRNYFAHHYYKDEGLDNHVNELCREVLVACLHSVLYIDHLIFEKGI